MNRDNDIQDETTKNKQKIIIVIAICFCSLFLGYFALKDATKVIPDIAGDFTIFNQKNQKAIEGFGQLGEYLDKASGFSDLRDEAEAEQKLKELENSGK